MYYDFYPETDYSEEEIVVASFYKFVEWDHESYREPILFMCDFYDVKGIILLAEEGINSTIAGDRKGIDALLEYLRAVPELSDLTHKESYTHVAPFRKIKVRVKKEIVTIKDLTVDPVKLTGTYIDAEDWNELISDPEVVVIDTRNDYEFEIGTFEGAINPNIENFSEFPEWMLKNVDPTKKVAMFCTGGIRCEKSTAWALDNGYKEVFHLKDGILKYLEEIPQDETKWDGNCFIFDKREALDHPSRAARRPTGVRSPTRSMPMATI